MYYQPIIVLIKLKLSSVSVKFYQFLELPLGGLTLCNSQLYKKNDLINIDELGYSQLLKIFQHHDNQIPIEDAKDILLNPEGMLRKLCFLFDIVFEERMLSWDKGAHPQDGIWGKYWYDKLWESTTFSLYEEKESIIDDAYKDILEKCINIYDELYQYRVQTV